MRVREHAVVAESRSDPFDRLFLRELRFRVRCGVEEIYGEKVTLVPVILVVDEIGVTWVQVLES